MTPRASLLPRLRVSVDSEIAFGPGKAELIRLIAQRGSIRAAAAEMEMSYNRAWTLVGEMNRLFKKPLVASSRGGGSGGGAVLTPTGKRVLDLYSRMETGCMRVVRGDWKTLQGFLR